MATAKKTKVKVSEFRPAYQVTLTEGEIDFLIAILSRAAGHPTKSPRKYADRIRAELERVSDLKYQGTDALKLAAGEVRFREYRPKALRPKASGGTSGYAPGGYVWTTPSTSLPYTVNVHGGF